MLRCSTTARIIALASTLAFATLATATVSAQATPVATDATTLDALLSAASSGDVVTVDGHIIGDFVVPAGVTLRGVDEAVIEGSGVGIALTVIPGAGVTAVESLKVVSDGRYGIWISGAGASHVDDVHVLATRGLGLAAEGTDSLALTDVRLTGPVTGTNHGAVPSDPSPLDTATHGLILLGVDDAALDGVHASGFAEAGGILAASTSSVWDSRFDRNVGTGLVIAGGETTLDNVTANGTYRGARGADERVAGMGIGAGANVSTTRVRTLTNQGFGLFHDDSGVVEHDRLASLANREGGVWAQNAEYIGLERAAVSGNRATGIVAIDSTYAMIADSWVVGTRAGSIGGGPALGDGISLVGTDATVDGANLRANARVGLLAALSPTQTTLDISLSDVLVAGRNLSFGVIFQRGDSLIKDGSSEVGVTKRGAVARNDGSLDSVLGLVGIVEPPDALPRATELVGIVEPPDALPAIDRVIFGKLIPTDGPF